MRQIQMSSACYWIDDWKIESDVTARPMTFVIKDQGKRVLLHVRHMRLPLHRCGKGRRLTPRTR